MTLGAGSDDAPLDLGSNGATGEKASSDDPVDLEKGATGSKAAAAEEEELDRRAMYPRLKMCFKVSVVRALIPLSLPSRSYLFPISALPSFAPNA